jgi:two-component system LytT family response regulator
LPSGAHSKIRALIVDDEPLARTSLRVLLQRDRRVEIVGECSSGMEAVAAIRNYRPDLVFLDVQMPECDGFDVLEMLGSELPRAIVFVTAYDQFALRAFDAGALDYLLKPFDNQRFELALERAAEKISREHDAPKKAKRLAVKSGGQILFIGTEEIDWVEAADYYSCLHIGGKRHLIRRSMTELNGDLDANIFCRIHRSAIVNLNRVRALESGEDGEHEVVLHDGSRLRLSRRYRKELQSRLGVAKSGLVK